MNPLEQFQLKLVYRYFNNYIDLSITNSTILVILSILSIIYLLKPNNKIIVNNNIGTIFSISYNKIKNIIIEVLGDTKYFPIISALFYFLLFNNLFGLLPYSFTTTSHFIFNFFFSLSIIIATTFLGFFLHHFQFFSLFVPKNIAGGFLPLIILIEIISYFSRIISLSVRLTANMLSGHILLSLISSFGFLFLLQFPFFFWFPLLLLFPFFLLEFAIAFIQTYVFILLTASYINDVVHLH